MLHGYEKHFLSPSLSADQILWERTQSDSLNRLRWAREHEQDEKAGIRSNAFHILYTYYSYGWFVDQNTNTAELYLEKSAELGHAQACYDIARRFLENHNTKKALHYIEKGIEHINEVRFNCSITNHDQKSMKDTLEGLKLVCKFAENKSIAAAKLKAATL